MSLNPRMKFKMFLELVAGRFDYPILKANQPVFIDVKKNVVVVILRCVLIIYSK